MVITKKAQMYRLFETGAFGNRPQTWSKVTDMLDSGFQGEVGLFRKSRESGGGRVDYYVPYDQVSARLEDWAAEGIVSTDIQITEMARHEHNLLQGELLAPALKPDTLEECGWWLAYNCEPGLTMREARVKPWRTMGPYCRQLLSELMDERSYANLRRLVEEYPGHVIEFAVFKKTLGVKRWNTIFWEVRYY